MKFFAEIIKVGDAIRGINVANKRVPICIRREKTIMQLELSSREKERQAQLK